MYSADPNVVLTPGKVYKAVGYRPKCATCLLHIGKMMHAHRQMLEKETPRKSSRKSKRTKKKVAQVTILELEEF